MIDITVTTEIAVTAEEAFDYLADVTNNPEWQSGVEKTEWTSTPPGQQGATYDQTISYRNIVTSYRVTVIDPGRSMTVESGKGATIPTTVTRTVRALSEGHCSVSVRLTGQLHGWRKLTKPVTRKAIRQSIELDYRRLKRHLEGSDTGDISDNADPGDTS